MFCLIFVSMECFYSGHNNKKLAITFGQIGLVIGKQDSIFFFLSDYSRASFLVICLKVVCHKYIEGVLVNADVAVN